MDNSTTVCCSFSAPMLDVALPPVLFTEFIVGLMGNFLALWMFIFQKQNWKPNSLYLTHLAVADSVVLFCLPFRADYYRRGKDWIYGDVPCRILLFMLAANRAAGIFFLTAITVDRYLKIVHPINRVNRMGLSYAMWVSCGLWMLILAMTVYLLTEQHFYYHNNRTQCESFNICMGFTPLNTWHNVFYVVQFFFPTMIVVYCTIRITLQLNNKTVDTQGKIRRAVYLVMTVAVIFIMCFFPSTISRIAVWILKTMYSECSYFQEANLAFYTSVCFTYFNSVLNPVVYYFSSPEFSGILQKFFNKIRQKSWEETQSSATVVSGQM
ncbi:hydroxycarboxylic acid receptor 3-like [Denticeps clupeoides]|uniref:hydroxycarboxylic acid receptor 3-like n=1 Tax=Denticeps clupeoides TaxID=299321 RepID=UPI0010A4040A|nr:hydroxycarboxylic acid receptor 3-like [Denticeps clupeoides]